MAEIASTNAALVDRAHTGVKGPLWLVADTQLQGRGRNARHWVSPPGNLYASLLLIDPSSPSHVAELSFVFSLALRDAVLAAAGLHNSDAVRLKWPNDLMVEGAKSAGLLLEGGQAHGSAFVVAGFGVNVVSHPEGTAHKATHLRAAGFGTDRESLLAALSDAVVLRLAQWSRGAGFAAIRTEWLAAAYGLGRPLRVATVDESFEAVFEGVDANGRLIAGTASGPRLVSAGDVFPLSAHSGGHAA